MRIKHLEEIDESYLKHMSEAWIIVITLIFASMICFIHSIFPFLLERTASTMVKNIMNRTDERQGP